MKRKRVVGPFLWGLVLLVPLFGLSCSDSTESLTSLDVPAGVLSAAQDGLANLKDRVPNPPDGELTLGEIFQVATMDGDSILKATADAYALISPNETWMAMVMSDDQPALMITVVGSPGERRAVSYSGQGRDGYASQFSQIRHTYPKDTYILTMVKIYAATSDYISITKRDGQKLGFLPMISANVALGKRPVLKVGSDALLSGPEMLAASRKAIEASMYQPLR